MRGQKQGVIGLWRFWFAGLVSGPAAAYDVAQGMSGTQKNNPLHGVTLEAAMNRLVEHYGWDELARRLRLNCFKKDPSVKSSLKFLRKTQWARDKVERLYISTFASPPA